ncbi:protein phosphatase PTC7 homolog [Ornithodoros turicata]|uniref:Protein phosphatase n=1 Tax=Ornithodoros turicata TaxID=34597 RepID=A0A2R5LKD2_9ACAR
MQSVLMYGRLLTRALANGVFSYTSSGTEARHICGKSDLRLHTATCGFPKEKNRFSIGLSGRGQFGDDACFAVKYKSFDVLGVADGVGGWRTYGVDPSLFSTALMRTCERIACSGKFNLNSPASILASSYYELLENKRQIIGSSTACVLVLNCVERVLYSANIGDSGFLVVRQGHVVHRSQEQQHYFNTPFQLCLPPPGVSQFVLSDSPDSAATSSFPVQEGDLILMATDGLFDNLPENMIVSELAQLKDVGLESIQQTVNSLALQARRLAFDEAHLSPFSLRARDNGIEAIGGKPDDITILLAAVSSKHGSYRETLKASVVHNVSLDHG